VTAARTYLAGIKERAEGATLGPWEADIAVRGDCVVWGPNGRFLMNMQAEPHWLAYPGEKRMAAFDVDARDAEFIARARTDLPRVADALLAVLAECEDMAAQAPTEIATVRGIAVILKTVIAEALEGK
jgi:hypothetical protein